MRRMGAPNKPTGLEQPLVSRVGSYVLRIRHTDIPWNKIQPLLRRALEVETPVERRSQAARDLATFLHAERPTRVQTALARPLLVEIWRNLNRN